MDNIKFYRQVSTFVADVKPQGGSVQQREIMGEDSIRIQTQMSFYIDFLFGDWCIVFGQKYIIQEVPAVKKLGHNLYEYSITARSESQEIEKAQFLFLGPENIMRETDFTIMGSALDFVNLVVTNINRIYPGWQVGSVVAQNEYRNMSFSKDSCLSALSRIASEYDTEFWIVGKIVNLGKLQNPTGMVFRQGKGNGLYEIIRQVRDSEPVITRLYAYGSDKNLPPGYRSNSKRLRMPSVDFIENNVPKYGIVENSAVFEDIFPRRVGTVTSIAEEDEFTFYDSAMDFDVNSFLLSGLTAKITFNTGQLAGLSFDIERYDHAAKVFTILLNKDNTYIDLPNPLIRMEPGDKYVITDIRMPDVYVTAAENELQAKAADLLMKLSEPQMTYQVTFDQKYVRQNSIQLNIGDLVRIEDVAMSIDREIRVIATTRDLIQEANVRVELADVLTVGTISKLQIQQDATDRAVTNVTNQINNSRQFNNQFIGTVRILNGTIMVPNMPSVDNTTGRFPVYWDASRGTLRVYRP
jgi:hypothetical protein